MKSVIWLDEALSDLKEIGVYISKDNKDTARKVLRHIKNYSDYLVNHPEMGRVGRVEGTRELILPDLPYILPYQITENDIRILAVMHTSRKWLNEFPNIELDD